MKVQGKFISFEERVVYVNFVVGEENDDNATQFRPNQELIQSWKQCKSSENVAVIGNQED